MTRATAAALAASVAARPGAAAAHDAFGDLGPFYGSLLHPAADPLQGALIVGLGAFLAAGPVAALRGALPVFAIAVAAGIFAAGAGVAPPPVAAAAVAVVLGLLAIAPPRLAPAALRVPFAALAGALAGLSFDAAPGGPGLPSALGGVAGCTVILVLVWSGLETLRRRLSPLAPAVVGSWVAAIGALAAAFAV